jgi:hypothetical protein
VVGSLVAVGVSLISTVGVAVELTGAIGLGDSTAAVDGEGCTATWLQLVAKKTNARIGAVIFVIKRKLFLMLYSP